MDHDGVLFHDVVPLLCLKSSREGDKKTEINAMSFSEEDRAFAIWMIQNGFSNLEIRAELPALSLGTIAAFRAHNTRGTYPEEMDEGNYRTLEPSKTGL
jgi:hypothetical protein